MKEKNEEKKQWRREHYMVVGDSGLNGLTKEVATKIYNFLISLGHSVEMMTEYEYKDECGFRGPVSTDNPFWPNRIGRQLKEDKMGERNEYTKFDSRYVSKYLIEIAKHLDKVWIENNSLPGSGVLFDTKQWNLIKPAFKDYSIVLIPRGECPGHFMQG